MEVARLLVAAAFAAAMSASVQGVVVFENYQDNGFFTPFGPSSPPSWKYGDSGWFGTGLSAPEGLQSITLGLAVYSEFGTSAGTTDLGFTFNDGDPSGLVFGTSATLYSTTISAVALPALDPGASAFFSLTIPLSGVTTLGGFNNVGWSVQTSNYDYDGNFGFQCASTLAQTLGFYTNNASFYDGTSWGLFSFGSNPTFGVANFVASIEIPAPATGSLSLVAGLIALRRRR
jgi:hypothetical protein